MKLLLFLIFIVGIFDRCFAVHSVFIPRSWFTIDELLEESAKQTGFTISNRIDDSVDKHVLYNHLTTLEQVLDAAREYFEYVLCVSVDIDVQGKEILIRKKVIEIEIPKRKKIVQPSFVLTEDLKNRLLHVSFPRMDFAPSVIREMPILYEPFKKVQRKMVKGTKIHKVLALDQDAFFAMHRGEGPIFTRKETVVTRVSVVEQSPERIFANYIKDISLRSQPLFLMLGTSRFSFVQMESQYQSSFLGQSFNLSPPSGVPRINLLEIPTFVSLPDELISVPAPTPPPVSRGMESGRLNMSGYVEEKKVQPVFVERHKKSRMIDKIDKKIKSIFVKSSHAEEKIPELDPKVLKKYDEALQKLNQSDKERFHNKLKTSIRGRRY